MHAHALFLRMIKTANFLLIIDMTEGFINDSARTPSIVLWDEQRDLTSAVPIPHSAHLIAIRRLLEQSASLAIFAMNRSLFTTVVWVKYEQRDI